MNCLLLVALVFFASSISGGDAATDKIICYVESFSHFREDDGKFAIEDIDAKTCTHVVYSNAGISIYGKIRTMDPDYDIGLRGYERVAGLKFRNPNLKGLISLKDDSKAFSMLAGNPEWRADFVKNSITFCQEYGFDGIDLEWKYPAQNGGAPEDKQNLVVLLQELKEAYTKTGYLISIKVSGVPSEESYDVKGISDNVDIINLMTYNYHNYTDNKTGANAPLYASGADANASVDASVQAWLGKGADPNKIALGLAFYGQSYQLADPNNHGIGAPAIGRGDTGLRPITVGHKGYNEICKEGWTEVWDEEGQVPYRYSGDQWVGYDNEKSIIAKINYAKQNNLGGFSIWSVDTDDFHGNCGPINPLLTTVKNNL